MLSKLKVGIVMNDAMNSVSTPIDNIAFDFLSKNWVNLLLIVVGAFALLIYILQERRKITEAASLVILQMDELQERIKEIQSYIANGQLNETAFYESRTLFVDDYWNRYKHYFVRKMDNKSYRTINTLYDCATEIQDQQQLMKHMQKNLFFLTQQVLANLETTYIISELNNSMQFPVDLQQIVKALTQTMPQNLEPTQKEAFENLLHQVSNSNKNIDFTTFWNNYNRDRSNIFKVINQNGLTTYTPLQIRLSLEKAINQYALLEVTGCDGYKLLKKVSGRRF